MALAVSKSLAELSKFPSALCAKALQRQEHGRREREEEEEEEVEEEEKEEK